MGLPSGPPEEIFIIARLAAKELDRDVYVTRVTTGRIAVLRRWAVTLEKCGYDSHYAVSPAGMTADLETLT